MFKSYLKNKQKSNAYCDSTPHRQSPFDPHGTPFKGRLASLEIGVEASPPPFVAKGERRSLLITISLYNFLSPPLSSSSTCRRSKVVFAIVTTILAFSILYFFNSFAFPTCPYSQPTSHTHLLCFHFTLDVPIPPPIPSTPPWMNSCDPHHLSCRLPNVINSPIPHTIEVFLKKCT